MAQFAAARLEHQRWRFQRHDAHRWWRCDADRYRRFDPRFQRGSSLDDRKVYNPDQPRVPVGSQEGGQWTSGAESDEQPIPAQLRRTPAIPSIEELLPEGGRNLGTFGSRVTVFVSPDVQDFESLDQHTGSITISLSGIGQALVVERDGTDFTISRYQVGTPANPGRGLDITVDLDDRVTVEPTQGI
jgi:hypothetical protein